MNEQTNIIEIITLTINTLLSNLISSIDNQIYAILDDLTFINTDLLNNSELNFILGDGISNGLILICNSLLLGCLIYYASSLLISHINFSQTERPLPYIFKLIICSILMNFSYFICEQIIYVNSLITFSIREVGEILLNKPICFSSLIENINSYISVNQTTFNIFSIDGLLKSFISIGLFGLTFTYSFRYVLVSVFVLLSPFAFLSLINNKSSFFFKSWVRNFISLLFIQHLISIILLITFFFKFSNDNLLSQIIYIGCISALTKANILIKDLIGGINITNNITNIKSLINRR